MLEDTQTEIHDDQGVNIPKLWAKYEDIAMHFNDLLMRLRTQAVAGIAAISTLVGIFTKTDPVSLQSEWLVAAAIFCALTVFWTAVFCLDFFYYNRLLIGAVTALKELEADAQARKFSGIKLSTKIIAEFQTGFVPTDISSFTGVFIFYGLVFFVLLLATGFSLYMHGGRQQITIYWPTATPQLAAFGFALAGMAAGLKAAWEWLQAAKVEVPAPYQPGGIPPGPHVEDQGWIVGLLQAFGESATRNVKAAKWTALAVVLSGIAALLAAWPG